MKNGEASEAIQLLEDAEQGIRSADIYFMMQATPYDIHHEPLIQYSRKIYSKLFDVLFNLKINIQKDMKREAFVKLEKIIKTNMYGNYVQRKIDLSDMKMNTPVAFRKQIANGVFDSHIKLQTNKGQSV